MFFSVHPGVTDTLPRIVESTDARLFGLDDAEVQKRRRYVGYVRTEIRVGLFALLCFCSIIRIRNIHTLCSLFPISHSFFSYTRKKMLFTILIYNLFFLSQV